MEEQHVEKGNGWIGIPEFKDKSSGADSILFWRRDPFDQTDDFHQGIDLATNKGTNILASASGTAYIVSNNKWYGNYIVLKHHFSNSVYYTVYMHLLDDSFQVKENEIVEQGQTIGLVGSSGDSTGYHLHFSILKDKYIFDAEHLVDPSFVLENHVQD